MLYNWKSYYRPPGKYLADIYTSWSITKKSKTSSLLPSYFWTSRESFTKLRNVHFFYLCTSFQPRHTRSIQIEILVSNIKWRKVKRASTTNVHSRHNEVTFILVVNEDLFFLGLDAYAGLYLPISLWKTRSGFQNFQSDDWKLIISFRWSRLICICLVSSTFAEVPRAFD